MSTSSTQRNLFQDKSVRIGAAIGAILFTIYTFRDEIFPSLHERNVSQYELTLIDLNYAPLNEEIPLTSGKINVYTKDAEGKFTSEEKVLSDLVQDGAIVHLWATWCAPCIKELPLYDKVIEKHPEVQHITVVTGKATPEEVSSFLEQKGINNVKIIIDEKGIISKKFNINAIPTSVFIKGKMTLGFISGALSWDEPDVQKLVFDLFK